MVFLTYSISSGVYMRQVSTEWGSCERYDQQQVKGSRKREESREKQVPCGSVSSAGRQRRIAHRDVEGDARRWSHTWSRTCLSFRLSRQTNDRWWQVVHPRSGSLVQKGSRTVDKKPRGRGVSATKIWIGMTTIVHVHVYVYAPSLPQADSQERLLFCSSCFLDSGK